MSGCKTYTKGGNQRALTKLKTVQWVKRAWQSLSTDLIVKSFKIYGITVDTDGNEDSSIHCIKQGNPAAETNSIIERCTAVLLREDENPFDFENSDSDESCADGELSFPSEDEDELNLQEQEVYETIVL